MGLPLYRVKSISLRLREADETQRLEPRLGVISGAGFNHNKFRFDSTFG
tara:strand:+ start:122 stop:268 length:147 start_codon:yes stop_codon:yes gene_type:complete